MSERELSYEEYLANVPPERREAVDRVWKMVREHMPEGYEESINKFLTFKTGEEWYVALANQKRYISLYLMPLYVYPEMKAKFDASGKKVKGGKSCIYFTKPEDLPLKEIAEIIAATPAQAWREKVNQVREESKEKRRRAA